MSFFRYILFIIIVCTSYGANSEELTTVEKIKNLPTREWVYQGLAVVDMVQTMSALDDPCKCFKENSIFLGDNPSDAELVAWTVTTGLLHGYITYQLIENNYPDWVVDIWLNTSIVVRAGVIAHNFSVGVRF